MSGLPDINKVAEVRYSAVKVSVLIILLNIYYEERNWFCGLGHSPMLK